MRGGPSALLGHRSLPIPASARAAFALTALAALQPDEQLYDLYLARMGIEAERAGVRIAPSEGKGLGVFALRRISAHCTVGDYAGEHLSQRDIDARYENPPRMADIWSDADEEWYQQRLCRGVGCSGAYIFKVANDIFLDGEDCACSNWTRFLNHGEPNLRVKALEKGITGKPRVWFVATRDIEPGEELLWDYGESYWKAEDVVV